MRRSRTSRRMCRGVVPSRSAASSNVISLSILAVLPLLCGGHCAKFLTGNSSLLTSPSRSRQGQPAFPLRLKTPAHVHPGGDHDHGLVVLGPPPGIQWHAVAGPPPLGERHPSAPQDSEGGGEAATLGRPMPAKPQHVRPCSQPQALQLRLTPQLPG